MPDTKPSGRGPTNLNPPSNTRPASPFIPVEDLSTVDGTTLTGDGTTYNPLVSTGGSGGVNVLGPELTGTGTLIDPVIAWAPYVYNVKQPPYSATGDGTTDDSASIRAAIAACAANGGGTVYFPNGTYLVSQDGSNGWCLELPDNIYILGESQNAVIIKLADGQAAFVRPFYVSGKTNVVISGLTIDGNKANQSVEEHRAGIFIDETNDVLIFRVISKNNTGDGIHLHGSGGSNCFDLVISQCTFSTNDRDGITLTGGGISNLRVMNCIAIDNAADGFHIEGQIPCNDITLRECEFSSADLVNNLGVTFTGVDINNRSTRLTMVDCHVVGIIFIYYCTDVNIIGNYISSPKHSAVTVYTGNQNINILDNYLTNEAGNTSDSVVMIDGVTPEFPDDVTVANNHIFSSGVDGVVVKGANNAQIEGNYIQGTENEAYNGVEVRAASAPGIGQVIITGNRIVDFARGVVAWGDNPIKAMIINSNMFEKIDNVNMIGAMDLAHEGNDNLLKVSVIGNVLTNIPLVYKESGGSGDGYPACPILIGGSWGERGVYSYDADPNGNITEYIGAQCLRRNGDGSDTLYVKVANDGMNTGWATVAADNKEVFRYTSSGESSTLIAIALPTARDNANYNVQATLLNPIAGSGKTLRVVSDTGFSSLGFSVETGAPLDNGDILMFTVEDLS